MRVVSAVTILECPDGSLSSVRDPYLSQDRLHMNLDRGFGNVELTGDDLVGKPFYQVLEDLLLPLRQAVTNSVRKSAIESSIPRLLTRHNWHDR